MDQTSQPYRPPGVQNRRLLGRNIVSLPTSPSYQVHAPRTPTLRLPMPPSASNFFNQNHFNSTTSPVSSPHIPFQDPFQRDEPPHLQYQPVPVDSRLPYHMPDNQMYLPQGPPPLIPPRPHLPTCPSSCNQEYTSAISVSKTLPSVAHIPLLTG